jgi:uncharacterized protein
MNTQVKEAQAITPAKDVACRMQTLDWERLPKDLDARGYTMIEGLLARQECNALAALYPQDGLFCSRVVMGRHGLGRGEYQYVSYL